MTLLDMDIWWCGACGAKNPALVYPHRCLCGAPRPSDPVAGEEAAKAKLEEARTSPEKPLIETAFCGTPPAAPPKKKYEKPAVEKTEELDDDGGNADWKPAPMPPLGPLPKRPIAVVHLVVDAELAPELVFELAATRGVVNVKVIQKKGYIA